MSFDKPMLKKKASASFRFAIIASCYNQELVDQLVESVKKTLCSRGVADNQINQWQVPGANEIPYLAARIAQEKLVDVIVGLGLVIAGDTLHHQHIAQSTSQALHQIGCDTGIPIINGIITVNSLQEAQERCGGKINRGLEYAEAAIVMAHHHRDFFRKLLPPSKKA